MLDKKELPVGRSIWDEVIEMEVITAYENPTKSKEISVEDMQKIVDANEKLLKELKVDEHSKF